MNEIQVFQNGEFGNVRTLEEDGKVLFCGNDVARALGFERPKDAIHDHCKGAVKRRLLTNGGEQAVNFIPESDVYRLAFQSKLPGAEKFTDWVTEEVLPALRRQGYYAPDMTAMMTQAIQAAVTETVKALIPALLSPKAQKELGRKRGRRRITSAIDRLETPLKLEVEEMILDSSYTYQNISDHLREDYGVLISKSAIGRYASDLYDAIEAQENAADGRDGQ